LGFLTESELGSLLTGFQASAFRFEVRDRYNSDVGREPYRKFLAGEPDDYAWHRGWMEMISRDRAQGKLWQRVRIVSIPLSDYNRYAMTIARLSASAGEDVRYMVRSDARRLGLDPLDAWILDEHQLVHLQFSDEDDTFVGAEVVEDESIVQRHLRWRDLALEHAAALEEFAATHP
jgi:hypothetical protein